MRDTFFVDDTVTMTMIRKPGSQQACAPRLRMCKRGPVRRARDPFSAACSAFLERGPSPRPTEARLRVSLEQICTVCRRVLSASPADQWNQIVPAFAPQRHRPVAAA